MDAGTEQTTLERRCDEQVAPQSEPQDCAVGNEEHTADHSGDTLLLDYEMGERKKDKCMMERETHTRTHIQDNEKKECKMKCKDDWTKTKDMKCGDLRGKQDRQSEHTLRDDSDNGDGEERGYEGGCSDKKRVWETYEQSLTAKIFQMVSVARVNKMVGNKQIKRLGDNQRKQPGRKLMSSKVAGCLLNSPTNHLR